MDSNTQYQLLCGLCLFPMGVVFVLAVMYGWAHPGPDPTPQELEQRRQQSEELLGEILWQEQWDRDHRRKK